MRFGLPSCAIAVVVGVALWWLGVFDRGNSSDDVNLPRDVKDDKMLPLPERKRIWDIEHRAFLLEVDVFPEWKLAIATANRRKLKTFFSAEFEGRVPDETANVENRTLAVSVDRVILRSNASRDVNADEFVDALLAYSELVSGDASTTNVSMGLVRLSPKVRTELNGAWRTKWKLRLSGNNNGAPVEAVLDVALELDRVGENNGVQKGWIRKATLDRVVVVRSAKPLMQDITGQTGFNVKVLHDNWLPKRFGKQFRSKTGGIYACDYDRDGVLDVLVEDLRTGAILYRGLGNGRFEDVTEKAGLPRLPAGETASWTLCVWADFDGDGDEDLILQDRLFDNRGDGTFLDVTKQTNLILTPAASYAVADFNRDGRVDLYVCHSGSYLVGQETADETPWIDGGLGIDNVLWRNNGNWQFEDVTDESNAGASGTACFAAVWFDANNDRWPDLLAVNEFGRNTLLINHSGKFVERSIDPVFGGFSMGVTAGDFDNDGATDLYVANMYSKAGFRIISNVDRNAYPEGMYAKIRGATTGNKLYLNRGNEVFHPVSALDSVADIGWAYGPNFVDLNGDGWLDIYATAGFRSVKRGEPDG